MHNSVVVVAQHCTLIAQYLGLNSLTLDLNEQYSRLHYLFCFDLLRGKLPHRRLRGDTQDYGVAKEAPEGD